MWWCWCLRHVALFRQAELTMWWICCRNRVGPQRNVVGSCSIPVLHVYVLRMYGVGRYLFQRHGLLSLRQGKFASLYPIHGQLPCLVLFRLISWSRYVLRTLSARFARFPFFGLNYFTLTFRVDIQKRFGVRNSSRSAM